ncbi:hypothetical protein B0I31_13018 [Saccharothrix carnea]|uniref:HNH endonuclease n=2 Tax=Saccharothrix carnea TaxID=1280637 RepID=A0A2P8HBS9_SACCR|nr:hypothetical protein B0I31_13018 [Saccharothrix carnea]
MPPLTAPAGKVPRTITPWQRPKSPSLAVLPDRAARKRSAEAIRKEQVLRASLKEVLKTTPQRYSEKKRATVYQCEICLEYARKAHFSADHKKPWAEVVADDFAGYETPKTPNDIRKIYNDLDNLRAVHQGCNNKRNANRSTDSAVAAKVVTAPPVGGVGPGRAVKELASTMTTAQLGLAYDYLLAIQAGTITTGPATTTTTTTTTTATATATDDTT